MRVVVEGVRLKLRIVRGGLDSWLRLLFGLSFVPLVRSPHLLNKHTNTKQTHKQKKKETRTKTKRERKGERALLVKASTPHCERSR